MVFTEFEINEQKKVVVCIITTVNDVATKLNKFGFFDSYCNDYSEENVDICVYKGIARCAPGDEWDESYGKKLAERRAMRARQVDVNERLKKYIKNRRLHLDNLEKYGFLKTPGTPLKR